MPLSPSRAPARAKPGRPILGGGKGVYRRPSSPTRLAQTERKQLMRSIRLACAALALALFAAPVAAQQQPAPPQPVAPEQPSPPATEPVPPPFPPMPSARPSHRWVDMGAGRSARHHRSTASRPHRTAARHHARHGNRDTTKASHHRSRASHHEAVHASKRTTRMCHDMTYKQIMRHSTCRALMRQDLESSGHRHHGQSRHRAHHRKTAKHRRHRR